MSELIGNFAALAAMISAAYLVWALFLSPKKGTRNHLVKTRHQEDVVDHLRIDPMRTFDLFDD